MSALGSYRGVDALVLGGGGFIGTWVAAALAHAGAKVTATARDVAAAHASLARHGARCEVRALDLAAAGAAARLLAQLRPAIVFNLAGYGVDPSERDESSAAALNTALVEELAESVRPRDDWSGQALVHAGSALEFGAHDGDFADAWTCRPTTLYGRTKLAGSEALRDASRRRGVRALTARLFTVYGPGEHPGRLLPTLLRARANGDPIALSEGAQRRDFTYAAEVAHGLLRLGALDDAVAERALNLATGRLASVREFIEIAADELGLARERLRFGALPTRAEEMSHAPTSVLALQSAVGWKPEFTIRQGLRAALAFERDRAAT